MKFYQNRTSGEIIGIKEMLEIITHPTPTSKLLGYNGYSRETAFNAIYPNKILGNGIETFVITNSFLRANYKRINKKIALTKHSIFEQYRHKHMMSEVNELGVKGIDILRKQTI